MKTNISVQAHGKEIAVDAVEKSVKESLKKQGIKVTKIESLNLYLKPQENACYYVVEMNDEQIKGKVEL